MSSRAKGPSPLQRTASTFFLQLSAALPETSQSPSRTGQLDVGELAQLGVRVRDFAFATGIPPQAPKTVRAPESHPAFRKQFQPEPDRVKRTSDDAKNEPDGKPQSKRSRLQREDTEPAIDELLARDPRSGKVPAVTNPQSANSSLSTECATSRSPSPWIATPRASPSPPPPPSQTFDRTGSQEAYAAISQPVESQAFSEQSQSLGELAGIPPSLPHTDDACLSVPSSTFGSSGSKSVAGPSKPRDDSTARWTDDDSMDVDRRFARTALEASEAAVSEPATVQSPPPPYIVVASAASEGKDAHAYGIA
ncbi:hypothetical protein HDZ31DRAFT_68262 [Schizophyllum fasciatum]